MNSNSTKPSLKELRNFGLILSTALYLILAWWSSSWWNIFCYMPMGIATLAIIYPHSFSYIYGPWIIVGSKIAHINITIFFTITYFLIFTPLSLWFKVIGRDPLKRQLQATGSYWEPYDKHESTLERYRRLF